MILPRGRHKQPSTLHSGPAKRHTKITVIQEAIRKSLTK